MANITGNAKDNVINLESSDILDTFGNEKTATNGADTINGKGGEDEIDGAKGHDKLYGGTGNDNLKGSDGKDLLEGGDDDDSLDGGSGNDTLKGGSGSDSIYGGTGVDQLYGGDDDDNFYFNKKDSGDITDTTDDFSDTIHDFEEGDKIHLKGNYNFDSTAGWAPSDGQYGIWASGSDWVITWNAKGDAGYHDVLVKGFEPDPSDVLFF
jgi:Ca2+-binding RTX toxin-like protein